jgi:hypothetical protein
MVRDRWWRSSPNCSECYPHQVSSQARLKCHTPATALKSLPQYDPRAERLFEIPSRGLDNQDEAQDLEFTFEFLAELAEAHQVRT